MGESHLGPFRSKKFTAAAAVGLAALVTATGNADKVPGAKFISGKLNIPAPTAPKGNDQQYQPGPSDRKPIQGPIVQSRVEPTTTAVPAGPAGKTEQQVKPGQTIQIVVTRPEDAAKIIAQTQGIKSPEPPKPSPSTTAVKR